MKLITWNQSVGLGGPTYHYNRRFGNRRYANKMTSGTLILRKLSGLMDCSHYNTAARTFGGAYPASFAIAEVNPVALVIRNRLD